MRKRLLQAATIPLVPGAAALIGLMPVVIQPADNGIRFNIYAGWMALVSYISGLFSGESWLFYLGKNKFQFMDQVGSYLVVSAAYVSAAAISSLTFGLLFGIIFSASRREWWKRVLELTSVVPDFVTILLLQFFIVFIAQRTGIIVFKVANFSDSDPAIVLPLLSMLIIPIMYVTRNAAINMRLTLAEDYIANAKARGMGRAYIYLFHALPNVFPFVKADLHKLIGIIMSNLFIVEYLYNIKGITKLLFSNSFTWDHHYQYPLVVNCLVSLLGFYLLIYMMVRLVLALWEKAFIR